MERFMDITRCRPKPVLNFVNKWMKQHASIWSHRFHCQSKMHPICRLPTATDTTNFSKNRKKATKKRAKRRNNNMTTTKNTHEQVEMMRPSCCHHHQNSARAAWQKWILLCAEQYILIMYLLKFLSLCLAVVVKSHFDLSFDLFFCSRSFSHFRNDSVADRTFSFLSCNRWIISSCLKCCWSSRQNWLNVIWLWMKYKPMWNKLTI